MAHRLRLAFAGGLTLVLLVALSAVGGVSYAGEAFVGAARQLEKVVSPSNAQNAVVISGLSAGGDQYRPGFGWGDENHTHTGPPGLQRSGGALAPPLRARPNPRDPRFLRVNTSINVSEQARLVISVTTLGGEKLLLSQRRSTIGSGVDGRATKNIAYVVLVPRNNIPLDLSIPRNLLTPGQTYLIRVTAIDPTGQRSVLTIRFRA